MVRRLRQSDSRSSKIPFLRDHFDTSHNLLLDLRDRSRAQFVQRCTVDHAPVGSIAQLILSRHLRLAVWTQHRRSSFLRTSINSFPDLSTYCTSTRETCTTAFAVKTVKLQQAARICIRSTCFGIVCTCLVDLRHHFGCACHDASTCCAWITPVSPPPRVTRGDLQELQSPSQRTRSHVSNSVTAMNLSSTFVTTSFTPSWVTLSGLVLGAPPDRLVLDHIVPLRFTRSAWCFLSGSLRLMSC